MITEPAILALCKSVLTLVKSSDPKAEAQVSIWAMNRAHTRFARNEITTAVLFFFVNPRRAPPDAEVGA